MNMKELEEPARLIREGKFQEAVNLLSRGRRKTIAKRGMLMILDEALKLSDDDLDKLYDWLQGR